MRQDEYSVTWHDDRGALLVVVCDGVGSFADSGEAATFLCRDLPRSYAQTGDLGQAARESNDGLREYLGENALAGASTLVAALIREHSEGMDVELVSIGDSTAWLLDAVAGTWRPAEAVEETAMHDTHVTSLPTASMTTMRVERFVSGGPLFLMSDGVAVPIVALDVRETLARWWSKPPHVFAFGSQVAFARKSHLDDRTVVGVWPATVCASDEQSDIQSPSGEGWDPVLP